VPRVYLCFLIVNDGQELSVGATETGVEGRVAKRVKQRLLDGGVNAMPQEYLDRWAKLFADFQTVRGNFYKGGHNIQIEAPPLLQSPGPSFTLLVVSPVGRF
jgi:hypothetical protein